MTGTVSSFRIEAQINSSAVETIFAIEAQHSAEELYNHAPWIDSDFDGIGDGLLIDNTFSYQGPHRRWRLADRPAP